MAIDYNPADFDASAFDQAGYSRRVEKPWGYELHWTPDELRRKDRGL